jgi:helix-turn-helix protein
MSDSERKVEDAQGKFMRVVRNGRELNDAAWQQCRVVLTTERIVLSGEESVTVPLSEIDRLGDRFDVNQAAAGESSYSTLYVGEDILLVSTPDHDAFVTNFYRAILDDAVVYVKHPAVEGGVVQDAEWQRGRLSVSADALGLVAEDGRKVAVDRDDIGDLEIDEGVVAGEQRAVIEVEHTQDGASVETHLSGRSNEVSVLQQLLEEGAARNLATLDLDPVERRVVMALYSGVSPFAISEFVGIDVDRVEEIYDDLLELDVLEVVRERTDVSLTARGRTVASEAMGER